eukprot:Nk52_evm11s2473 gene=Nk52_evmTU11s2473
MFVPRFTFCGCGFMGMYHLGVATALREAIPELLLAKEARFAGASAGSIVATLLATNASLEGSKEFVLDLAAQSRQHFGGALNPSFNLMKALEKSLEEFLGQSTAPAPGRLTISITQFPAKKSYVNTYWNFQHVLDSILYSCFIPLYGSVFPHRDLEFYKKYDGGFTDNLPLSEEGFFTVSPFTGTFDITPSSHTEDIYAINLDRYSSGPHTDCGYKRLTVNGMSVFLSRYNLTALKHGGFPPSARILEKYFQIGHKDALDFLRRRKVY